MSSRFLSISQSYSSYFLQVKKFKKINWKWWVSVTLWRNSGVQLKHINISSLSSLLASWLRVFPWCVSPLTTRTAPELWGVSVYFFLSGRKLTKINYPRTSVSARLNEITGMSGIYSLFPSLMSIIRINRCKGRKALKNHLVSLQITCQSRRSYR